MNTSFNSLVASARRICTVPLRPARRAWLSAALGFAALAFGAGTAQAASPGTVAAWGDNSYGQTAVPVAAQSGVTAIAAAGFHTVVLKNDGSVVAWGYNDFGQTTVPVAARSGVTAIEAGVFHTVVLKNGGGVVAWGAGTNSIGTYPNFGQTTVPVAAQSGVTAISAGDEHTVALKNDGSVLAWGHNTYGQTTVPVAAQSGVVAIAAGGDHTVVLKNNGSVLAWGNNTFGQTTVPVTAQSGVVAIAAGGRHTVALKNDGSVLAWGHDPDFGQTTVPIAAQSGVTAIAAGGAHTVALKNDGSVLAWGNNANGQTNVPVAARSGVTAIAAGGLHTVALLGTGFEMPEIAVEQSSGANLTNGSARVDFGSVPVGGSSQRIFIITNSGTADLTGLGITITGADAGNFTVTANPTASVGPESNTTFTVTFSPANGGAKTAALHLFSNDSDESPFDITLTGTGIGMPEIAVEQPSGTGLTDGSASVDFGSGPVGGNVQRTFTIRNLGNADLTGLGITITGPNSGDFTVTANPTAPVGPGGSTAFTVTFSAGAAGVRTAVLQIASNDSDESPFDIALIGIVGNPGVTGLSPSNGPTTARVVGNPITVRLFGTLLQANAEVRFGARLATVTGSSSNLDYLDVTLPAYPPGCDCATETNIAVTVTVTVAGRTTNAPQPFVYEIVKSRVPQDFPAIQPAIDAALPGTCVVVAPGNYINPNGAQPFLRFNPDGVPRNNITVASQRINFEGASLWGGADFNPQQPVVVFDGNNDQTILTGFDILLGKGGILVRNGARPQIKKNLIDDNFTSGDGAGILVIGGSRPSISDNSIAFGAAGGRGGGIAVIGASAVISNNDIFFNDAGGSGGGIAVEDGWAEIVNNIVVGSTSGGRGGGLSFNRAGGVICNNRIEDNEAAGPGGGIYLSPTNAMEVRANQVVQNVGANGGGVALVSDFPVALIYNLLVSNETKGVGGGLYFNSTVPGVPLAIALNSFLANFTTNGGSGGAIYWTAAPFPTIENNVLAGNSVAGAPGSQGGGIAMEEFAGGVLRENTLVRNSAQIGGAVAINRKAHPLVERNIMAFNRVDQTVPMDKWPTVGDPPMPVPPPFLAPAIYLNDAGPGLLNNTLHGNVAANDAGREITGAIHAVDPGVFRPRWINNLLTTNSDWGHFCATANAGLRLDYNDFSGNPLGALNPASLLRGQPFIGNLFCDPQYVNPSENLLDFRLGPLSCARSTGEGGADLGALTPDGRADATRLVRVMDTASPAALTLPAGSLLPASDTEVVIVARHFSQRLTDGEPLTALVWFALNPAPTRVTNLTVELPLIKPLPPGTMVELAKLDLASGVAARTGILGTVDATGWMAVVPAVNTLGWLVGVSPLPALRIACLANMIVVSWESENAVLQEAGEAAGPWHDVAPPPTSLSYRAPMGTRSKFYRLR